MSKVTFVTNEIDGIEHAVIEHADGSFTSMPKAIYDEQQAAQAEHLNGIVDVKAATI